MHIFVHPGKTRWPAGSINQNKNEDDKGDRITRQHKIIWKMKHPSSVESLFLIHHDVYHDLCLFLMIH